MKNHCAYTSQKPTPKLERLKPEDNIGLFVSFLLLHSKLSYEGDYNKNSRGKIFCRRQHHTSIKISFSIKFLNRSNINCFLPSLQPEVLIKSLWWRFWVSKQLFLCPNYPRVLCLHRFVQPDLNLLKPPHETTQQQR